MALEFVLPGEWIVEVKGGQHYSGVAIGNVSQLGMAQGPITFTPQFYTKGIHVDDFGPNVPAAVQTMMSEVNVNMTLIFFDQNVLDICVDEAMGGGGWANSFAGAGFFTGQGKPLDGGRNMFMSGNHMISMSLFTLMSGILPVRVRNCYLLDKIPYPLGTEVQAMNVTFKGLPYQPPLTISGASNSSGSVSINDRPWIMKREIISSGAVLWDHFRDSDLPDDDPFVEPR